MPAPPGYFPALFRLGYPGPLTADDTAHELPGWWYDLGWDQHRVMSWPPASRWSAP